MKFLILLFFSFFAQAIYAETITLRSDLWCPYACDPKSDKPGFMVEIAQAVFNKHGHKVEYDVMNWPRAIVETREGKYTGIVGASRADVKGFVIPVIPSGHMENFLWVRSSSSWHFTDAQSLKKKKVGVINDYSYGSQIDSYINKNHPSFLKMSGEDPLLRMIQMTETSRLDGFIENPVVLDYVLANSKKSNLNFKRASTNLADDPDLFIAFSPMHPKAKEYARLLDSGIKELRKNGALKKILEKYALEDWEK